MRILVWHAHPVNRSIGYGSATVTATTLVSA